tara:strand:+ start:1644 stop:2297 length:654 start_codon:yes stop_codon:yes gene_type:complete
MRWQIERLIEKTRLRIIKMWKMYRWILPLVLLGIVPSVSADTFSDGMRLHLKKDYFKSAQVFHGLAQAGHVRSQFMLGTIYEQGLGLPSDLNAAAYWYEKAATGNNPSAQYNLGIFYQFGKGVPKSAEKAAAWLLRAANNGHGKAQNNLSTFYYTGVGVKKDLAEAWKWLSLAADQLKGAGRDIVLKNRTAIEKDMSSGEVAEAKRRLTVWRAARKK